MGPVQTAWDSAGTRAAWRSYALAGLRWLVAAAVCVGLAVGGIQLALAGSRALLAEGTATRGTVVEADADSVTFRYDADGESFEQTLTVVSGRTYAAGEEVDVRHDRDDPETARLLDEPRRVPLIGPAVVVLFLVAVGAAPVGAGVLLRALSWRRSLQRRPWELARLRMHGRAVYVTRPGEEPVGARLLATTRWRTKTLLALDGQELPVVFDGHTLLLTADGTDTVFGARRTG